MHGIKNLKLLDRSQAEISNNKGKCSKKEKEAGYFHDNVLITINTALLQSYARIQQYCEMLPFRLREREGQ